MEFKKIIKLIFKNLEYKNRTKTILRSHKMKYFCLFITKNIN